MEGRRCYACSETRSTAEFAVDAAKSSGRKSICLECDRRKSVAYYEANLEAKRAKCREYSAAHRDERRAYRQAYRESQWADRGPRLCRECGDPSTSRRHALCDSCRGLRRKASKNLSPSAMEERADRQRARAVAQEMRERSRAEAEAQRLARVVRANEAARLRSAGHGWEAIAGQLGYANASGPWLAVKCIVGVDPRTVGVDLRKAA